MLSYSQWHLCDPQEIRGEYSMLGVCSRWGYRDPRAGPGSQTWGTNADHDSEELTLADAAEMVGISPATLGRWAIAERVAGEVTADGRRIFRRGELLKSSRGRGRDEEEERH